MTQYAVYNESGIWAVGGTPVAALARFAGEGNIELSEVTMATAPMTDRLAARIEAHGYDCKTDRYDVLPDGTLDVPATVQMVDAAKAAEGYIEYRGEAEDAEDWLDSLVDYTVELVSDGVKGWGEYTHLLRLVGEYIPGYNAGIDPAHRGEPIPTLYYLVTAETARRAL